MIESIEPLCPGETDNPVQRFRYDGESYAQEAAVLLLDMRCSPKVEPARDILLE